MAKSTPGYLAAAIILSAIQPAVSATPGDTPKEILVVGFDLHNISSDRRADFFEMISAFAKVRRSDQRVRTLEFSGADNATIRFVNSGMHGGGIVSLQRSGETWIVGKWWYFM